MVDRALAEVPGALRQIGLLDELDHPPVALVGPDPILVVGSIGGNKLAAHALDEKEVHLADLVNRGRRAVGAPDRGLPGDPCPLVRHAVVGLGVGDHHVLDAARMLESQPVGVEQLKPLDLQTVGGQSLRPEVQPADRDRQVQTLGLVGATRAHPASLAVGEARQQRR